MTDTVDLLERTTTAASRVVANVKPDQLGDATPCTEWTVRDLLNHMIGCAEMFAGAAAGEPSSINPFGTPDDVVGVDPSATYDDAATRMVSLWRQHGLDGTVPLLRGDSPAQVACTIAMCDQLVHAWDLAQATGQQYDADAEAVDAAWDFTKENMGPEGRGEGKPFAQIVEISDSEPKVEQLMAFMGRRRMQH
jgi:uncharacterized protein (TIGR03086 family)